MFYVKYAYITDTCSSTNRSILTTATFIMLYKRSHFPVRITKHTCRDMYEMNNNGTEIGVNKYWEQNKKSQVQSTQRVDVGKKNPTTPNVPKILTPPVFQITEVPSIILPMCIEFIKYTCTG